MPYKVHILEINVLGYLTHIVVLKVLIITMLEMMLSLLLKVLTTIELRLWVAWKSCLQDPIYAWKNVRECLYLEWWNEVTI